jgi:hypothetical protein
LAPLVAAFRQLAFKLGNKYCKSFKHPSRRIDGVVVTLRLSHNAEIVGLSSPPVLKLQQAQPIVGSQQMPAPRGYTFKAGQGLLIARVSCLSPCSKLSVNGSISWYR